MKKIFFCFSVLLYLLLALGCGKDSEETTAPVHTPSQFTLTYTAGENGSINGITPQIVNRDEDGSLTTAVPDEFHHFTSWSDGVTTSSRTDRKVTADLTVTANFAIDQYTLNYTAKENGSIDGANPQTVDHYGTGSVVTALPAEGYHFVSWNDGVNTPARTDSDVTADLKVTATFARNQYTLDYSTGENGSIDGASRQTLNHGDNGTTVTAVPGEHHHFKGWSDGVTTASRTDSKVTANLTVKANFAMDQYTLTYTAGENGTIDGAKSQKVDHGTSGNSVTAVSADGYHFVNWSDGLATASRTDSDVTADLEVTATFAVNQYTLTYKAGENGSIEGINVQTLKHGDEGSAVEAVAEKGYHFVNWSDGMTVEQRIDSNVMADLTVSAIFAINTYTIGGSILGLVEDTRVILQNNGGDDLVITANGEFHFATELLDTETLEVTVLTQPTSPNQTCTVNSGSGKVSAENVTDVVVKCVLNTYTVGGTVSGLPDRNQLILRNNENDDLVIYTNGIFTFDTPLDDGSKYKVKVSSKPERPNWTCDVENSTGSLTGKNVTDIIVDCYPEAVLHAEAGIRKVKLNWNNEDFSGVTFDLCRAQDEIPPGGFSNCQDIKGGTFEKNVTPPLAVNKLMNDIPYWFQLVVHLTSGRQTFSQTVMSIPIGGLNDSGINWCTNDDTNLFIDGKQSEKNASCVALKKTHPDQDALHGRDASARYLKLAKTGNGAAGFDFSKVCMNGKAAGEGKCPPNPSLGQGLNNWACTRDNVTGLTWEIKMKDGLRSNNNTYSWYNQDEYVNGGAPGLKNGGTCQGSDGDTQAYVQAINELALCGASDWRLPTKRELLSIVDNGIFRPAIDTRFFPNTLSSYYWTSSPYPDQQNSAWQVYFLYGEASINDKVQSNHLRLVRGRTVTFGLNNP